MSMLLMVKAMQARVGNPSRKLVLLKLADNANDDGICFPSYQYIADQCEISKRSAITHIDELIKQGFVSKKLRKNKDGSSSNLYQLHLDAPSENSAQGGEGFALGGVKNLHQGSENSALGGSENFAPITSHSINQSINHKKTIQKNSALALLAEFGITEQLAEDFIIHRKSFKGGAEITRTVLNRIQKQADLAKLPLAEVLAMMIERGWRGFKASWDWDGSRKTPNHFGAVANPHDKSGAWAVGRTIEIRGDFK